jgi:glycerophosphoryl diester phosphodiesterase
MDKLNCLKRTSFESVSRLSEKRATYIEAHRGVLKEYPENTLSAFQKAIDMGLDSIELDIWLTKDEIPVVIHGGPHGEISETTNGEGKVNELSYRELSEFQAGPNGETIPMLESVLELCKGKIFINLEIKDTNHSLAVEKIIQLLDKYNMKKETCISSFHHEYYNQIKNRFEVEDIEFGFLYDTSEGEKVSFEFENRHKNTINVWYKEITKEFVDHAHSKGMGVQVWFCLKDEETDEVIRHMFECGVDVYCTNNPKRVIEIRNELYSKASS